MVLCGLAGDAVSKEGKSSLVVRRPSLAQQNAKTKDQGPTTDL
jgi:hypothetical protein